MRPTPLLITMLAAGGLLGSPAAIMAQDDGSGARSRCRWTAATTG